MLLVSEAHCAYELWGLAVHPTDEDLYATAGDDCTVRIWSRATKQMLRKAALDSALKRTRGAARRARRWRWRM